LIGGSIGQVLFQEASIEKQLTGKIINSFSSTIKKLLYISIPSFSILYFVVEDLFAFIFGEEWRVAGVYTQILIPFFAITFIVSPLTILNQVNKKNKLGMQWQIGLFILYITLYLIVNIISSYYLYFLFIIYNHAKETNV